MRCEFIDSQKKTKLLKDENNYVYWHYKTNETKSKAWYRCTKRRADIKCPSTAVYCIETAQILKLTAEHNHSSPIVEQFVREKENTLIRAAVDVGNSSCNRVLTEIKTAIDQSQFPEGKNVLRKSETLRQAIFREKRKSLGISGNSVPKTAEEIKTNLPASFKVTTSGGQFLRFCDYVNEEQEIKFMMLFLSDHGKHILSQSEELYCDGTFDTCPPPFQQIYIIMGKMQDKRALPCVFVLAQEKDAATYKKMLEDDLPCNLYQMLVLTL